MTIHVIVYAVCLMLHICVSHISCAMHICVMCHIITYVSCTACVNKWKERESSDMLDTFQCFCRTASMAWPAFSVS